MVLPGWVWCLLLRLKLFGFIVFDFFNFPQQLQLWIQEYFLENEPKITEIDDFSLENCIFKKFPVLEISFNSKSLLN